MVDTATATEHERATAAPAPGRWLRRPALRLPVVFAAYLAGAVFATWPLARFAGSRLMGDLGDPALNAWIFGWGAHGILHQPLHLFTANMFHPDRLALAYSENVLGMSLPMSPVFWLTHNAVLTENLALFVWLAIGGVGTFALVRRLTGCASGAFVAGLAFTIAPYRLSQITHPHVIGAALVPLVLLVLLRLEEPYRPPRRTVVTLGAVVAAQFWASINGGVLALCAVAGWAIWLVVRSRRAALPPLGRALAGVAVGVALSLPVLMPYLRLRQIHPNYSHPVEEVRYYSATPGSYLLPFNDGPVFGGLFRSWREPFRTDGWAEEQLFPGLWLIAATIAGTAAVALRRGRHARRRALAPALGLGAAVALTGLVLSLGPRWGGREHGFPLPFALAAGINGFIRVPARLGLLVPLGMAICGGVALAACRPRWRPWLAAASVVLLLAEVAPPSLPTLAVPPITSAHRAVAGRPGVVLALPTAEFDDDGYLVPETLARESLHLYLSTANFAPLTNGYGAYQSPAYYRLARAVADLPSPRAFQALGRRGVRTVVVQTDLVVGTTWADVVPRLARWPGVRTVARDPGVVVYDISGAVARAMASSSS